MIIACDVDDVCADLVPAWLALYNLDYWDALEKKDVIDWDISKFVVDTCGKKIYDYLDRKDLYPSISPIEGALEGIVALRNAGHRVVYATANGNGVKRNWLLLHGFLDSVENYVECKDKSLIRADVLIDDGAHNLRVFMGKRIQFLQPWNKNEFVDGAWLACDWGEIPQIIQDIEEETNGTFVP